MLCAPYWLGHYTCFAQFGNTHFLLHLHCLVRSLALPIEPWPKLARSTAQYCSACLVAGQHQFRAPVLVPNSSAGSHLGQSNLRFRFGGVPWAPPIVRLPRRIIPASSMISCSLTKIALDHSRRPPRNISLLKLPSLNWMIQIQGCLQKVLRFSWSRIALISTSAVRSSISCVLSVFMMSDMCVSTSPAVMVTATAPPLSTWAPMERRVSLRGLDPVQQHFPRHILGWKDGAQIAQVSTIDRCSSIGTTIRETMGLSRSITDG